jgi:cobalt-precorrin 5A hydrolase/precorrin-3B C17-methyltransferase
VIGYRAYLEHCSDLRGPAQDWLPSPIGDEVVRAKQALAEAAAGRRVALVCSGDSGIYGMASIVMELSDSVMDIEVIPGVTAAIAGAAVLGAPLGHDHVAISLSDLMTSWEVIEQRVRAAAESDLVVSLYNPRSRGRTWQLDAARRILLEHRPPATPVGIVTDAGRTGQTALITTLATMDVEVVGMTSLVIVGATTTAVINGRMVTPRGYR